MASTRLLTVRLTDTERFELKRAAGGMGITISDLVRRLLSPVVHPSYEGTADVADTIAAQPIAKPTFTGHGRHDDFARAAITARRVEASRTAQQWLTVNEHATINPSVADREHMRAVGVLAD